MSCHTIGKNFRQESEVDAQMDNTLRDGQGHRLDDCGRDTDEGRPL
jgi:hypothetical protein